MKKATITITALICAVSLSAAPAEKKTALSLEKFITTAMAVNPSIRKIRENYNNSRSITAKTASIKDIMLTAGTSWSWYNKVFSSGALISKNQNEWSVYATIAKKFPKLLGMDASLAFANNSVLSTATDGTDSNSHTPSLTLTVTIPLLKNFLGKVDNNSLKKMKLALQMADRYEMEAVEALLVTLKSTYIDWALAVQKVSIYRGLVQRSRLLLNQTTRKRRMGIADIADLALARQNWLTYRAQLLSAQADSSSAYHTLLSYMVGKPQKTVTRKYIPVLNWDKNSIINSDCKLSDLRVIQISRLSLEDTRLSVDSANSSLKPDLNFIFKGGTGSSKTGLGTALSSVDQNNLYGGLEFSMPLQNTEQKNAKKAAIAAYKMQLANYQSLRISMGYDLKKLIDSYKKGKKTLQMQKQVVYYSLIRINAIYKKYRQGRVTLDKVIDARDSYATQQISYIEKSAALKKVALEFNSQADRLYSKYMK